MILRFDGTLNQHRICKSSICLLWNIQTMEPAKWNISQEYITILWIEYATRSNERSLVIKIYNCLHINQPSSLSYLGWRIFCNIYRLPLTFDSFIHAHLFIIKRIGTISILTYQHVFIHPHNGCTIIFLLCFMLFQPYVGYFIWFLLF